jgi:peptidoglycan/xylan/chitin deacetylase (PgdA/CDA1 family)
MILGYHRIAAVDSPLAIRPDTFRAQLAVLAAEHAVRVVPLAELSDAMATHRNQTCVAITFDDAYEDTLEAAAPILHPYGFPATVFAPTRLLGANSKMTPRQLKQLAGNRFDIGAHSRTHVDLRRCSSSQLVDEVQGAKADLEDVLGDEVRAFAYPFGAFDRRVRQAVLDAGYEQAVTTRRAWVRDGSDRLALPRNFVGEYAGATFRAVVYGGLNYVALLDRPRPPR